MQENLTEKLNNSPFKEQALDLFKNQGLSPKEIAAKLNIPVPTVYTWLRNEHLNKGWAKQNRKEKEQENSQIEALKKENEELKKQVKELERKYQTYFDICGHFQDYIKILKDQLNKQKISESILENREKRRIRH